CPHCKTNLHAPDHTAGKPVRCSVCKQVFLVPAAVRVAAAPAGVAASAGPAARPTPAPAEAPQAARPPSPAPPPAADFCPACKSPLWPGAISGRDCGFLLQPDTPTETEGPPALCPNPACGVANPPGERTCQRCGQPLPRPPGSLLNGRYRIKRHLDNGGFGA